MTYLAAAIMVESLEQAHADAAQAAERGADLVEFRIDRFVDQPQQLVELVKDSPLPCIVTCRAAWEGGQYEGDETSRIESLAAAAGAGARYVDMELAAWQKDATLREKLADQLIVPDDPEGAGARLILSSHDFDRRPSDLLRHVAAMAEESGCQVAKLAWQARSLRDNLEAFELLRSRLKPTIALCMGQFGQLSRILAGKFGGFLTFASLAGESVTAPGQVDLATMKQLYRWDAIDAETSVYGVIGWPIGHSMSPAIHNAGFEAVGHNGVYVPLPIPTEWEHFKATVAAFLDYGPLDFRGASVTIPHKQHLLRFVREWGGRIEPLAQRIGAANTLTVHADGTIEASNTDYAGAIDAVCDALDVKRDDMAGRRVAVIGAGGAARAIVAGFAHHGATVVVYNRTAERAQQLAEAFDPGDGKVVAAPLDDLSGSCCEVYINCTPIGMHPQVDATPMPELPDAIGDQTVVFDTIYNPIDTRLLREARAAGAMTISGVEMFVRQGAAQFEQWTGKSAPREVFRRTLLRQLDQTTDNSDDSPADSE
jgi:3-dehydroquinate dehydratase/shikimate dehydrogenase